MNQFDNVINQTLAPLYNKQTAGSDIFTGLVYLLLIVYASQIAPQLPLQLKSLFQNSYFKMLALFLILYLAKYRPTVALLVAVGFILSVNYANTGKLLELMQGDLQVQSMQTTNQVTASASNPQTVDGQVTLPPMVVQPQVVSTAAGQVVTCPQVIVAPLHVIDANGDNKTISPVVQIIDKNSSSLPAITPAQTDMWSQSQKQTQGQADIYNSNTNEHNYDERQVNIADVYPLIENQGQYYETPTFEGESVGLDYAQSNDMDKVFTV